MRHVDDELPGSWRILMRAGVLLSPRLRARILTWRRLTSWFDLLASDAQARDRLRRIQP